MGDGYTTQVSALGMAGGLAIPARLCGGQIRSITIGNQTTATTAVVFGSLNPIGGALYAIVPGQFATLPIMNSDAVSLVFVAALGAAYDGGIYVHADTQPLAASGFASPTTAPIWVWDSSTWDGTAVWSK